MLNELKRALVILGVLSALTGIAYPALVTGVAQAFFPAQANGSLIERDGKYVGSRLIGQYFVDQRHFSGRPSATAPMPFNAASSSGSNLGPLNPALEQTVIARIEALRESDRAQTAPLPVDLVTSSASGLDPQISVAGALWQVPRVARARHLPEQTVRELVLARTEGRQWAIFGEPRVNVLLLNLALDEVAAETASRPPGGRDRGPGDDG
ncbi:potassium-transporting ATPase subunit KdpC [Accumulibacter sp.]|uniref:potassium-transporting ATPase subunit KdpC n=1 Tax=Accumulibacter sp. TaxID=2053492 RepID=UPI0025DC0428|nr:potassium-transporting ATPase subunit KdpC [Accumulibacter sp.]MCM8595770.1 potassium-transporting ATPase subunit KdpC [Accumulibacter sp.]MCM8626492.1 potassium-transporting ATPase subunit KdpC [Accumulibacter sp.]MDS4049918.1 potassium-transporting ATPase subunit KdpC [Accumulibacter sp.]